MEKSVWMVDAQCSLLAVGEVPAAVLGVLPGVPEPGGPAQDEGPGHRHRGGRHGQAGQARGPEIGKIESPHC